MTGVTSRLMVPVTATVPFSPPSATLTLMVVSRSYSVAGMKATLASAVFTLATVSVMVHTPVAGV